MEQRHSMINIRVPFTEKATLLLTSYAVLHFTSTPFQCCGTETWMLYRVSLGQEALYLVLQGSDVFLHDPFLGSSAHRMMFGDCNSNNAIIGRLGFGSNSHNNTTLSFTVTSLDGVTVK